MSNSNEKIISRSTAVRIMKDVKEIMKNPLTDNGIYYYHHEQNILCGHAMIIGPSDSIYANGFYFFEFVFPTNYPHSPPKLIFNTNDGVTRFNPNLYRDGKVCLSILNTWKGEQWTACQTIRTVLLTLITLFHNMPLTNEPGFSENHSGNKIYNKIIEFKNYDTALVGMISKKFLKGVFIDFFPIIKKHMKEHHKKIYKEICKLLMKNKKTEKVYCNVYNMNITIDWNTTKKLYEKSYNKYIDSDYEFDDDESSDSSSEELSKSKKFENKVTEIIKKAQVTNSKIKISKKNLLNLKD